MMSGDLCLAGEQCSPLQDFASFAKYSRMISAIYDCGMGNPSPTMIAYFCRGVSRCARMVSTIHGRHLFAKYPHMISAIYDYGMGNPSPTMIKCFCRGVSRCAYWFSAIYDYTNIITHINTQKKRYQHLGIAFAFESGQGGDPLAGCRTESYCLALDLVFISLLQFFLCHPYKV